ncbi:MAG: hypothetical protein QOE96_1804 [Blastocatellia bacterium]|jgi:hypothetical protein|nr:hypothetical protein [Blastocatellia bacterium]
MTRRYYALFWGKVARTKSALEGVNWAGYFPHFSLEIPFLAWQNRASRYTSELAPVGLSLQEEMAMPEGAAEGSILRVAGALQ